MGGQPSKPKFLRQRFSAFIQNENVVIDLRQS